MLDPNAPLVAGGSLVVCVGHHGDAGRADRRRSRDAGAYTGGRVGEQHVTQVDLIAERHVRRHVIDIVALDALIRAAEAGAYHGLALAGDVPGEADSRRPVVPAVLDQARRDAILAGDADAVQIERNAGKSHARYCTETWTREVQVRSARDVLRCVSRVVEELGRA